MGCPKKKFWTKQKTITPPFKLNGRSLSVFASRPEKGLLTWFLVTFGVILLCVCICLCVRITTGKRLVNMVSSYFRCYIGVCVLVSVHITTGKGVANMVSSYFRCYIGVCVLVSVFASRPEKRLLKMVSSYFRCYITTYMSRWYSIWLISNMMLTHSHVCDEFSMRKQ